MKWKELICYQRIEVCFSNYFYILKYAFANFNMTGVGSLERLEGLKVKPKAILAVSASGTKSCSLLSSL